MRAIGRREELQHDTRGFTANEHWFVALTPMRVSRWSTAHGLAVREEGINVRNGGRFVARAYLALRRDGERHAVIPYVFSLLVPAHVGVVVKSRKHLVSDMKVTQYQRRDDFMNRDVVMFQRAVSYTHLTLPTTPYV